MKKRNRKTERNRGVYDMRQSGAYYREIAEHFGISIIRVRQILEAEESKNELQAKEKTS
jgi:transposase